MIIVIAVFVLAGVGYILISQYMNSAVKDDITTEKVLTVADLERPNAGINSKTSDASVDNLTKELKVKIDKQIADKVNPIETVITLIGVLCNTVNTNRQNQCVDYITEFLDTRMDALKLSSDVYGQPNELQITYWRAQFYGYLINNYEFIMNNKFTGSDGKLLDTTDEQLKYINLYLTIAQNPTNLGAPHTSVADGRIWYDYNYQDTDYFVERRKQLEAGGA
jgi:hypothetical protein